MKCWDFLALDRRPWLIEMTAPIRAGYVNEGLRRLRVPAKKRHYFAVHVDAGSCATGDRAIPR
jgi:hypothetical protein